jgi:predicted ATP-grasp superfamily ATP-dependent carboligase
MAPPDFAHNVDHNAAQAAPGWPPVVVAGAYQTGIVLMRNLARRGLSVSCVDCYPEQPGFKTVYGKAHLCPYPNERPAEWVRFMVDLAKDIGGRPVLIPSADHFVTAIACHAAQLQEHFVFPQSGVAVQALLATKERQYDIAAANGFPVPRTQFIRSWEELRRFGEEARFPCLLKPVHCLEWERFPAGHPLLYRKTALALSLAELEANYRLAEAVTSELVVQEVIEGPDDAKLVYLSCYSQNGVRLGACLVRELRTDPIYFGSASVVEPIEDPATDALCDGFLRRIGYVGLCEIELKRDSRDQCVKLIEANPRYSVTSDAAPYAGVDLGWLHYLDLIGQPVELVQTRKFNFRHIVLRRDFACFRSYRKAGLLSWREWFVSYRPPVAFFDFDVRDWRVTWDTMIALFKILAGPLYRRVFPKRR